MAKKSKRRSNKDRKEKKTAAKLPDEAWMEGFRLSFQFWLRHHAEQNITPEEVQAAEEDRLNIAANATYIYADDVAATYHLATVEEVD